MNLRQIIIIFFLGSATFTSGQNISLSFSSNNISLPDTIDIGDTICYNLWLVNDGNTVITDYIALEAARFCQSQGLVSQREIAHINPGALFPGDSIKLPSGLFYEEVHQQNYLIGDNIVVIWPRVEIFSPQINEHLTTQIYVQNNSMISGSKDAAKSKRNFFYFSDNTIQFINEFEVLEVALYNMLGAEVYKLGSPLKAINLQNMPVGTYFMIARLANGTIKKEKIIVQ